MILARYHAKRDFARTREPAGRKPPANDRTSQRRYVIQKHAARRLHYDFRLEIAGVLKSWAVPKGIPTTQGDKRLAMQVEDHPVEYGDFEGTIAPGNYGAGTVMVWDIGTYELLDGDPTSALRQGKLVFQLDGSKLRGQWTLVKMRHTQQGENAWLLIKTGENVRPISARAEDRSAKSGRSMKQIAAATDAVWESNRVPSCQRASSTRSKRSGKSTVDATSQLEKLPKAAPRYVEPMKTRLADELPHDGDWLIEVKLDGIRAIGIKDRAKVQLFSRRPRDLTNGYPQIVKALEELAPKQFVVDGEIVALDEKGRSSFQLLQSSKQQGDKKPPLFFYVFDLLNLEGHALAALPLIERKARLQKILENAPELLRFSPSLEGKPDKVWKAIVKLGLEGVIAKQSQSQYEPGRRSGAWIKVKAQNEQEFVIGGYTPPRGSRAHFGAVLVGYYEDSKLLFASKVGTGFDTASLRSLYQKFQKLRVDQCPFLNLPTKRSGRYGEGITALEMKRCVWLRPELVCQVKFYEWTRDGNLRQPVFLGLREDKKAAEVIREIPRSA
jgi:bifunctional non-homologous end joining protein LigD